jgi:hypothetical protein
MNNNNSNNINSGGFRNSLKWDSIAKDMDVNTNINFNNNNSNSNYGLGMSKPTG